MVLARPFRPGLAVGALRLPAPARYFSASAKARATMTAWCSSSMTGSAARPARYARVIRPATTAHVSGPHPASHTRTR